MSFIDLHTHLLPHYDDGSDSWQTSLEMLRQGVADGISEVACTPHVMSKKDFDAETKIIQLYEELVSRAQAAHIDIKIHLGSELYIQPDIDFGRRIVTFANNGRYFLIEFPMNLIPDFVAKTFFDYVLQDHIPVVAHPERYAKILTDPGKAYEFVERGAVLQVNAGSLLGIFGQAVKNTAIKLLENNLVGLVASDAHDLKIRPFKLKAAYEMVAGQWGVARAQRLFIDNPRRIILGHDLIVEEPIRPASQSKTTAGGLLDSFLKKMGIQK
jgi:protein-tyrosine phosphatase